MRTLLLVPLVILFWSILAGDGALAQSGCGLKPLKPLPPLGCKDLVAQCVCDDRGRNCSWTWVCVPR